MVYVVVVTRRVISRVAAANLAVVLLMCISVLVDSSDVEDGDDDSSSISVSEEAFSLVKSIFFSVLAVGSTLDLSPLCFVPLSTSASDVHVSPKESSKVVPPAVRSSATMSSVANTPAVSSKVSNKSTPVFSTKSVSESVSIEAFLVLERKSITRCAMVFKYSDSKCGVSRLDFGSFTSDIIHDKLCFEHDLFVYVHQDCERPDLSYCK